MAARGRFRMTPQRKIILEELNKVTSHPSADGIYEMVRRRLPRISLGTIYRNLDVLSERGMVQKLELGCAQMRFDGNVENHYHVRCIRCGRVENAPVDPVTSAVDAFNDSSDFEVIGHRLEFIGICPQCKKNNQSGGTLCDGSAVDDEGVGDSGSVD